MAQTSLNAAVGTLSRQRRRGTMDRGRSGRNGCSHDDAAAGQSVPPPPEPCRLTRGSKSSTCDQAGRELDGLGEMQRRLLPASPPSVPDIDFTVSYRPSGWAGGDYYEFLELSDGRWGILIADVSGHGAPAAIGMAVLHATVRACPATDSPAEFLTWVNEQLAGGSAHGRGDFVTAFYAVLDPASGALTYASAGHLSPRLRSGDAVLALDDARGLPLGIVAGERYAEAQARLSRGDALVLYTDGITEAMNGRGAMFGNRRLDRLLRGAPGVAGSVAAAILDRLDGFTNARPAADDRTLIVVARG